MKPRRRAWWTGLILVSLLGGLWWWCTRPPRLNVVLITLDTTRADHLGCYGRTLAQTGQLDRMASRGVVFENAYTAVPLTLPSHATMHTGLLPPEHGVRINGTSRLADGIPTLAEILRQRGYRTGAFVSSLVLDGRFGLSRGFEHYDDHLPAKPGSQEAERPATDTISAALAWIRAAQPTPFFCWVHLYDPHVPYQDHHAEFKDRFQDHPYDAELAYMDLHLGRLFDFISQQGWDSQTLFVIAGDHGEGLHEHGEPTHGFMAYNSTMRVPLIVASPRQQAPRRVTAPVSLVDLFPTILDELRLAVPGQISGRTLRPALRGESWEDRPCYGETEAPYLEGGWSPLRTWTTARWKYIRSTRSELYDLVADPAELHNLLSSQPGEAEQLAAALGKFESKLQVRQGQSAFLNPAEQQALTAIGYAGGHEPARAAQGELRDIKDTIQYAERAHECSHLVAAGQADRAQAILEEIVQALPDYAKGWGMLGICCLAQDHFAEAERNYRRALEVDANQNFARIGLGRALLAQNRLPDAITELESSVDFDPTAVDGHYFLGEACLKSQRWDDAKSAFAAVLQLVPDLFPARLGLADAVRDSGNLEEARALYEAAVSQEPESSTARSRLGQVLVKLGQEAEALSQYEEFLQRNERQPRVLADVASLLAASEDPAIRNPTRAVALAEQACRLTDRRDVWALRALAAAYVAKQRFDLAVKTGEDALELARKSALTEPVTEIERELDGYRQRAAQSNSPASGDGPSPASPPR